MANSEVSRSIRQNSATSRGPLNSGELSDAVARWLLGVIIATGGALLWLYVVLLFHHWLLSRPWMNAGNWMESRSLAFQADGEPILQLTHPGAAPGMRPRVEFQTLDGQPLGITEEELRKTAPTDRSFNMRSQLDPWTSFGYRSWSVSSWDNAPEPLPWRMRLDSLNTNVVMPGVQEQWFFIGPARRGERGYLVGYDVRDKRCVGYIGTQGLSYSKPPFEQQCVTWEQGPNRHAFVGVREGHKTMTVSESPAEWEVILPFVPATRDRAYVINLTRREARLAREQLDSPLLAVMNFSRYQPPRDTVTQNDVVLRFRDRLEFVTPALETQRVLPLPEELRDGDFRLVDAAGGGFVASYVPPKKWTTESYENELLWLNADGSLRQRRTIVVQFARYDFMWLPWHIELLGSLMPLKCFLVIKTAVRELHQLPPTADEARRSFLRVARWNGLGWAMGFGVLSGVPFAIACWRRQRRFGASRFERLAWPALVYLFGLVGWIAFLTHRRWPTRISAIASESQVVAA